MKTSKDSNIESNVEYIPSRFIVHKFTDEISEKKIIFQVIKMLDSLLIYINDKDQAHFNDLSLAMQNRYGNSSIGTNLLGSFMEETSKNMACRLSDKLKKAVFLSCNLETDRLLIPLVEKRLHQEMKNYPEKF